MPWYVTVYELLLQVSLAGCLLLAVATAAVLLLREPARKIRVMELALLGLLALPLVTLIPGYPRVALLPASEESAPRKMASPVQPPASPGGPATIDVPPSLPVELAPPRASTPPHTSTPLLTSAAPVSTPSLARADNSRTLQSSAPLRVHVWQFPTDYRLWIVCGYLTGVGLLLLWSLVGLVAMRRLIRSSHPADDATRTVFQSITGDAGARVRLLVSSRAGQPCAFGAIRPTIVLPQALIASGDAAALRFALAHEWSHVSRGDVGIWTLSTFARLLHFQQPLVWLLRQHLRRSQDYLADAAAAGAGTPEDYAEFLTSLSQRFKSPRIATGLGIVSRRSDLHRRVVMLVEKQGSLESIPPKRWNFAILVAGLLAVATVASLRAEPQVTSETPEKKSTAEVVPPKNKSDDSFSGELGEALDALILGDPKIVGMQKQLEQHENERDRLASEPSRTPEHSAALAMQGHKILQLADQMRVRAAELRTKMIKTLANPAQGSTELFVQPQLESQTQRFILGEEMLAQTQTTSGVRRAPFSGKIRPGDRLQIEIVGGLRPENNPPRTVEPDGNVVIGAAYGDLSRMQVGGMTLIEAGKHIEAKVRAVLKEPHVLVTYVGHDPDVIAEGEAAIAIADLAPPFSDQPVVLAPLDTIEIILPLTKPRVHKSLHNGKIVEVFTGEMPQLSGTYVIEPDGRIALSQGLGRLAIAGMTEAQASDAMRKHLGEEIFTRTALPTTQILKRGHAVFPEGKLPDALYRIKPGDSLLIGASPEQLFNSEVDSAGNVGDKQKAAVAGLTLEEAQMAVRKAWTGQATFDKAAAEVPWLVTIGGWREEATPGVIDRIEGDADTRSLRLEDEVEELKQMIRRLQLSR